MGKKLNELLNALLSTTYVRLILFLASHFGLTTNSLQAQHVEQDTTKSGMTAGWEEGRFFLKSEDNHYLLNIGGRLQPRYEYQSQIEAEDLSSFFLRRIRLDLRGHLFDEKLTFRFMPEMARTATLRDGWINYTFSRRLNVIAGQFTVPFQRQRFISGNRQHFTERSLPSKEFGFPNGYDIGVGLHGRNSANTFSYGAAIFDGAGRNIRNSNSPGNMASARITWAATGTLPRDETDLEYSDQMSITLGAGIQGATLNEVRDWDLGRSAIANTRADWLTGTADLMLQWKGFSIAADGYLRKVYPDDVSVNSYTGWASMITTGYFIVPQRLELTGRFSELAADDTDNDSHLRAWDAGLNIYHRGHFWKTHINFSLTERNFGNEYAIVIQWHLLF